MKFTRFVALIFLVACAHNPSKDDSQKDKGKAETTKEGEIASADASEAEQIYVKLSEKLQNLISKAQKAGPDSVKFLGSDIYLKASAASIQIEFA